MNKEKMQNYNTRLNANNTSLDDILNVINTLPEIKTTEITINPSIEKQIVTPEAPYTGLSKVTVNPVTSDIDENIKAENIKKGVEVLGVTGDLASVSTDEYFNTTITSSNRQDFAKYYILKKIPTLTLEDGLTSVARLFYQYYNEPVPFIDTSNVDDFSDMFAYATKIKIVPEYDASKGVKFNSCFIGGKTYFTTFGGFKNIGMAYDTTMPSNYANYILDMSGCINLTHDSLMNIINNLYDIASKGVQPQTLKLGTGLIAKLTEEELAIATNKGWIVS